MPTTRRQLLASAAAALSSSLVRAGDPAGKPAAAPEAGEGPGIGVIGLRYQGAVIAAQAKPHGRIVGIADVDRACLDLSIIDKRVTGQTGLSPGQIFADVAAADRHVDYRRLLDDKRIGVILIGTPDHWHSKMLIDADRKSTRLNSSHSSVSRMPSSA